MNYVLSNKAKSVILNFWHNSKCLIKKKGGQSGNRIKHEHTQAVSLHNFLKTHSIYKKINNNFFEKCLKK